MNKKQLFFIAGLIIIIIFATLIFGLAKRKGDSFINKVNKKTPNQLHCVGNEKDDSQGFEIISEYFIDYNPKTNEVIKSTIEKKMISSVEELNVFFKNNTLDNYRSMNELYGGITTSSANNNGSITVTAIIDYNKLNIDFYLKDYPTLKAYVSDENKLLYEGLKSLYQAEKANCEMIFK